MFISELLSSLIWRGRGLLVGHPCYIKFIHSFLIILSSVCMYGAISVFQWFSHTYIATANLLDFLLVGAPVTSIMPYTITEFHSLDRL